MLAACEFLLGEPREIILAGERDAPDMQALLRELTRTLPAEPRGAAGGFPGGTQALSAGIPVDRSRCSQWRAGRRAYVCRNYACQLPVSEPAKFAELLQY